MLEVPQRPIDTIQPNIRSLQALLTETQFHPVTLVPQQDAAARSLTSQILRGADWERCQTASSVGLVWQEPLIRSLCLVVEDLTVTWHLFILCPGTYKCSLEFYFLLHFTLWTKCDPQCCDCFTKVSSHFSAGSHLAVLKCCYVSDCYIRVDCIIPWVSHLDVFNRLFHQPTTSRIY